MASIEIDWAAVQGIGTAVAAIAALAAVWVASQQLSKLTDSNQLLAKSNDAMTQSNLALTRPYVVVDFELRTSMGRAGNLTSSMVNVLIENVGRTPAKNLTMKVDRPFEPSKLPDQAGWEKGVRELNRVMDGKTTIRSLTHVRPLRYYLDEATDIMGGDNPTEWKSWTVSARYYDSDGHEFNETWVLELGYWRLSLALPDPVVRISKVIEGLTYEIKTKKLPTLDFVLPEPARPTRLKVGRPRVRNTALRRPR